MVDFSKEEKSFFSVVFFFVLFFSLPADCNQMLEITQNTRLEGLLKQMILVRGYSQDESFPDQKRHVVDPAVEDIKSVLFESPSRSPSVVNQEDLMVE